MIFFKTVSAGNDFIHIDITELENAAGDTGVPLDKGQCARLICDRHLGAGADGVVFYQVNPGSTDFDIYNQDGSRAELSGNGMAGLTALLLYLGQCKGPVKLNTCLGQRIHHCIRQEGRDFRLQVEIGAANFSNLDFFPFLIPGQDAYSFESITFYPVSIGNPHAVVLVDKELSASEIRQIGMKLESAPIFPFRTNVEFIAHPVDAAVDLREGKNLKLRFYERGVGETLASSTGSAAVYAILSKLKYLKPGDYLTIPVPGQEAIKISGNLGIHIENCTKIVYKGVWFPDRLNVTGEGHGDVSGFISA